MANKKDAPRDLAREQEALSSNVKLSGTGEDPAVRALLEESFQDKPDSETLDIRLALQEIIRGQASVTQQIAAGNEQVAEEFQRLKGRMVEFEEGQRRADGEQKRLLEHVHSMGERLRMTDAKRAELLAEETGHLTKESMLQRVDLTSKRRQLEAQLRQEPTEMVIWPVVGVEMVRTGQSIEPRMLPAEIRIRHLVFRFEPGKPVTVPKSVAAAVRDLLTSKEESTARGDLIDAAGGIKGDEKQDLRIATNWEDVGRRFHSPASRIPIASR